ncbi:MAG: hypothetical protein ABIW48_07485 [Burkholderiales bacterium]
MANQCLPHSARGARFVDRLPNDLLEDVIAGFSMIEARMAA